MATQSATVSSNPLLAPKLSVWQRLIFAIKLRSLKALVTSLVIFLRLPSIRQISNKPTLLKIYSSQKTLTNRVFIPKSYQSGGELLPLYLDIHGGGFALASPHIDDRFCYDFANDNKVLVVSLDYPKAPSYPFPSGVRALVDIVKAVLEDESLPFDRKKVAIGGFSAGANLSFALCQNDSLQGRIGGLVSYYGPLDFTIKTSEKLNTRPANAGPDPLEGNGPMFNWGYINPGQDLMDPLLSVALAPKAKLPPKIYLIGCELDMLCRESETMAERLVSEGTGDIIQRSNSWEKNGIKWEKIEQEEHGFDAMPAFGKKKLRIEKRRKEMFESTAEWLFREVYT